MNNSHAAQPSASAASRRYALSPSFPFQVLRTHLFRSMSGRFHHEHQMNQDIQTQPPLPSSNKPSTDRRMRKNSASRQGRTSGREPTCNTCSALNHGSSGNESSVAFMKSYAICGAGLNARRVDCFLAFNALRECGVGSTRVALARLGFRGVVS